MFEILRIWIVESRITRIKSITVDFVPFSRRSQLELSFVIHTTGSGAHQLISGRLSESHHQLKISRAPDTGHYMGTVYRYSDIYFILFTLYNII